MSGDGKEHILTAKFEYEVMHALKGLGFHREGKSPLFLRKTSGALVHAVEISWDVDCAAGLRVAAWHPVLHTKGAKVPSIAVIMKESIGDRLGESYIGSNLFFPCNSADETRESSARVKQYLAAGGVPFMSAIAGAEDIVVAGAVAVPAAFDVQRANGMLRRATGPFKEWESMVLSRLPVEEGLPKADRFKIMSAQRWLDRIDGGPLQSSLIEAGFRVVRLEHPMLSQSVTFYRARNAFTDMVHVTLGHYGARSEIQCLTWIPQFNGLSVNFDLSSTMADFIPELTTAWWLGEGGLADRQAVINFMDLSNLDLVSRNLSKAFAKADEWFKRKLRLNDLFDFPPGAIEAAERLGAQGYRQSLEQWRQSVMTSVEV